MLYDKDTRARPINGLAVRLFFYLKITAGQGGYFFSSEFNNLYITIKISKISM